MSTLAHLGGAPAFSQKTTHLSPAFLYFTFNKWMIVIPGFRANCIPSYTFDSFCVLTSYTVKHIYLWNKMVRLLIYAFIEVLVTYDIYLHTISVGWKSSFFIVLVLGWLHIIITFIMNKLTISEFVFIPLRVINMLMLFTLFFNTYAHFYFHFIIHSCWWHLCQMPWYATYVHCVHALKAAPTIYLAIIQQIHLETVFILNLKFILIHSPF